MAKAKRSNKSKVKNLNGNRNDNSDVNVFNESKFTTTYGLELKCFPISSTVINGAEVALRKEYKENDISLDAPIIKIPSMPGAADVTIELNNEDICKIEGNEEETKRRLDLYHEWVEATSAFESKLMANKTAVMLAWGLRDEGYYGTPQPGGLSIPKNFKEKVIAIGTEWPDDPAEQMMLYLSEAVLLNGEDARQAWSHIGMASNVGNWTVERYEQTRDSIDATFRNQVAKQSEREPLPVGEGGEGDDTAAESGELAV